ncbi:mitochondrial ribonuclease P catalytic subunit [Toxorhynchites rutilus septentrionalis]|uniref:mitochondrial ribonuclease P catalytic subunit n=1 Tax=Toxorhynchites rutilus septentrionalis TaxID=329112 RepID=UPI00247A46E3|nr:mitochondrial ribonuclease P catalytic subunit [Toxorhynchites rutilus septentrionalis]
MFSFLFGKVPQRKMIFRYRFPQLAQIILETTRYYSSAHRKLQMVRQPYDQLKDLKEKLSKNSTPSSVEWNEIRKSLIDERRFTSSNIDSTILGLCETLESGKSYLNFLRSKEVRLNLAVIGRLLRLYRCKSNLSEQEQQEILDIYTEMRENHSVLDANTCEHLVVALTLTNRWRLSFELLDMIKLTGIPNSVAYSCIIAKCFNDGEPETGWKMLEELATNKRYPSDDVFMAWIDYSMKDGKTFQSNLLKMLAFTNDKGLFVSKQVGNALLQLPVTVGIHGMECRITDKGKCSHCKSSLASIAVPEESFRALKDAFLQSVIVKKEIFNKTTPEELKRFQHFVKQTKPYDVVIDGLNVAFSTGNQKSPATYAMQLASVVRHYVQRNKRVMVIGRQHMNRWKSKDMKYIREKSYLFLTEDLSQDDPFLLYAALESGPDTDFFSRDLMRKHSFLLGEELSTVFKRWQQQHQYSLLSVTPEGRVLVKAPFQFELFAHSVPDDPKRWHVPLVDDSFRVPKMEKQAKWVCLKFD